MLQLIYARSDGLNVAC